MSIVRRTKPLFEKTAAVRGSLGEDPNNYPTELLSQLMTQHQFLSDYNINVQIHKQDDVAGFLYGVFVARPMTAVPTPDTPSIRIPIIIAGRRVFPFDVFITMDGRFQPLTQSRVSSTLFSASTVNAVPRSSLPAQAQIGTGGGFPVAGEDMFLNPRYGQTKTASVLEHAATVAAPDAVIALVDSIQEDARLRATVADNPAFSKALHTLVSTPPLEKKAAAEPTAVAACTLEKGPVGWASTLALLDSAGDVVGFEKQALSREDVERMPLALRQQVLKEGAVLLADAGDALTEVSATTSAVDEMRVADKTGIYAVLSKQAGADRVAVVTDVVTLEGKPLGMPLVIGKTGGGLQTKLAGIRCGDLDLGIVPASDPVGRGVFVLGDAVTEPVEVRSTITRADGAEHRVVTDMGSVYTLKVASVNKLVRYQPGKCLLPSSARFMPIQDGNTYVEDPDILKMASAVPEYMSSYVLRANSRGGVDIADNMGTPLHTTDDALQTGLVLAALGDTAEGAREKVARICGGKASTMRINPRRALTLGKRMEKAAAAVLDVSDIRVNLVKVASQLSAQDTVDAVLSLEFVTPENAATYVEYLPTYEDALAKLCEMLIGVRVGVPDVPENALTSAVTSLDRSIQGLKKLQIRLSLPSEEPSFN